ncbi:MAG: arylsulfatase [Acetobacteraceae bacterium]|jgi:arylsulfatase A-like enzyme
MTDAMTDRPNVVLILADDMGFSDLGCYGGEISTQVLDALGRNGVRFSSFYNTARCSPSRASLLTGLHPHQTGIGVLTNDDRPHGYPGNLNRQCVTLAEVLRDQGYATCLSGKWHLASDMRTPNDAWPTRRGFDRFFGTLTGCGSFYQPGTLTRGEQDASAEAEAPDFFYTDAIATEAVRFIEAHGRPHSPPLFLYTAFTAPHWPLHAKPEDIARYSGVFDRGWDALRITRMQQLIAERILPANTRLSERDPSQPAWNDDVTNHAWQAYRMQVYAAQIEALDRGVGRIVEALQNAGKFENTLFIFLSDNGASAEELPLFGEARFSDRKDIVPRLAKDGSPIRIGNTSDIVPGPDDTYSSYGQAWANLSNTPFRFYKRWVHEGGIAAPLIIHWPVAQLDAGAVVDHPFQLVDVVPTVIEATGAHYPPKSVTWPVAALEGRSMLAALRGGPFDPVPLYWEHTGNAAIRMHKWKLVREYPNDWELYDIEADRTELNNLAAENPTIVADLTERWQQWAARVGVLPWETMLQIYRDRGLADVYAAG